MTPKAVYCDACIHASIESDGDGRGSCWFVCAKGHRPKFYEPATVQQANDGDYGWKRVCDDFRRSE